MMYLQIQYEVDLSNVVGIFVNIALGLYLASSIPKKLSSNRTEQDLLIDELKLIISMYRETFDIFSKTAMTTGVNFDFIKDSSERNTAKTYAFIDLIDICGLSYELKSEIADLKHLDKKLRKGMTNVPVNNGLCIYKPAEVYSINTNYDLISKHLYKILIRINRKGA